MKGGRNGGAAIMSNDISEPMMSLNQFGFWVEGLDHPECVVCGPDGTTYAGGEAGQIYRTGPEGKVEQIGSTGGFVLGICLDAARNVYACDLAKHEVFRVISAQWIALAPTWNTKP